MIVNILWIGALFAISTSPLLADLTAPHSTVNFNVVSREDHKIRRIAVNLTPTETFLANENVPVWITTEPSDETDSPLIPQDILEKLGPFTAYRDSMTCSAALYFHKTQHLEGTIGHHHLIHKLKYNPLTKNVELTENSVIVSPLRKHRTHKRRGYVAKTQVHDRLKSLRPRPEIVYVETLVMIDYDITEDFGNDYASIVTYVLSLLNSVDMLYSQIKKPNIKINIAGIIIATKLFPQFARDCHGTSKMVRNQLRRVLITTPSLQAVKRTLEDYQNHIPLQSYDIVVLLTRATLVRNLSTGREILGISLPPIAQYKRTARDVGVAIASDSENFDSFPIIAHEIAHLLDVPHDEGPLFTKDGKCIGNLMRRYGTSCVKCLRFGGTTPQHLATFFSSRAGCIFHNKPRSLTHPQSPQLFWSPYEQCECYGFESVCKSPSCFPFSVFSSILVNCESTLKCRDQYGVMSTTNVHMDGTPCARNRNGISVCWNHKCVRLSANSERVRKNCGAV